MAGHTFDVSAAADEVLLAFAEEGGRIALMGGADGRAVRLLESDGLSRFTIGGTPWPGKTTISLGELPGGATRLTVTPEVEAAAVVTELRQLEQRASLYFGGAIGLDVVAAAPPDAVWTALFDPLAVRAHSGLDLEVEPRPGGLYAARTITHGENEPGRLVEAGTVSVIENARRLAFAWELSAEAGSEVELRLFPVSAMGGAGDGTLLTLTHAGMDPDRLAGVRERAAAWLTRLERVRDFAEGTVRLEEEILVPLEAARRVLPEVGGRDEALVELCESEREGRCRVRYERPGIAKADRAGAYVNAMGRGLLLAAEIAARAKGATIAAEVPRGALGPRRFEEEILISVPPASLWRAFMDPKERLAWAGEGVVGRPVGDVEGEAAVETRSLEGGRGLWLLGFELLKAEGGRTLVRASGRGFRDDGPGATEMRSERLRWAWNLLCLRARAETGRDLRPLSKTGRLYPEAVDFEISIDAPPATILARIGRDLLERGESRLPLESASRIETVRPLAEPEETACTTYDAVREGAGTRLRIVERGFTVEEAFWSIEERMRLIPGMALARGDAKARIESYALQLDEELGRSGILRMEVDIECRPGAAYHALSDAASLGAWQRGAASLEPWVQGRFLWAALPGDPEDRVDAGVVLDASADRALVLSWEGLRTPSIVELRLEQGQTARTRIVLRQTGLGEDPDVEAIERRRWARRLSALASYLEGRIEAARDIPSDRARAFTAITHPADLSAWLAAAVAAADPEPEAEAAPEAVWLITLTPGGLPERCRVLERVEGHRIDLEWPFARGEDASAGTPRLSIALEDRDDAGALRAVLRLSGIPSTFDRPAIHASWTARLPALLERLAAHLKAAPRPPDAAPALPEHGRLIEIHADLPLLPPNAAFDALLERLPAVFGPPAHEERPRLLRHLVHAAPGEPEGVTLVEVTVEPLGEDGARVRAIEKGFLEGSAWDARLEVERHGWERFFEDLSARDAARRREREDAQRLLETAPPLPSVPPSC